MIRSTWLAIAIVSVSIGVYASEPGEAPVASSPSAKTADVASRRLKHESGEAIRSLLVDKEFPLTGIRWGANLLLDAPLNSEPENAEINLRRGQLAFWRSFGPDWMVKITLLYNRDGEFELDDNYVRYNGWETAYARLGVFTAPFSLEKVSNINGLTFMERALPVAALSEPNSAGFGVLKRTPNSILSASLALASPDQANVPQEGQALVMHYVRSPIDLPRSRNVHFGGSLSYRINAGANSTRFKTHPEVSVGDDYFVDTGSVTGADRILRLGLEGSSVMGPFSWQTELLTTTVERDGYDSVQFWGGYVYASWFLSGESRNYDTGNGSFSPLTPKEPLGRGGKGAFELAARVSFIDLSDKDIIGGQESNISLGLNWYLNEQFRLMGNLIKVRGVKRPGNEFNGEDPLILALRLQWQLQ